jgi:uncharacterized protein (TIGR03790 family)
MPRVPRRLCCFSLGLSVCTMVSLVVFANPTFQPQTSLKDRVLVVYNAEVRESKQVAEYYLLKRSIPASHICEINTSSPDQIKQDEFDSNVKQPIRKCLDRLGKDTILYIVLSHQTPFLLEMGSQTNALDQFVADIWDEYLPERTAGQLDVQPYFGGAQREGDVYQPYVSFADYRRQPNARTIYSVWRLDAPNAALAKGLVDKALYAEANGLAGIGCFDRNRGDLAGVADFEYGAGDWEIHRAADFTRQAGFTVIEDDHGEEFGTSPAPLRCDHAALYAGWYALNHYNDAFSWNPGAIGIHLDSASATNPRAGHNWATNALARGITVTAGATTEPYLDNVPHPDQAFLYLFQGANVGDALLRSERLLKWNIINIGDPLYRPFLNSLTIGTRVSPSIIFALLPQITLGETTSAAAIAVSRAPSEDLNFSVMADNRDLVAVPPKVTISAGNNAVRFPIGTHHVSADPTTVRVRVKANGYEASNTLVLFSLLASLRVSPEKVKGGSLATGTLVLRRPALSNIEITLKSSDPAIIKVPAELTTRQGQDKTTFQVATQPVSTETSVEISAAYEGLVRSTTLKVVP